MGRSRPVWAAWRLSCKFCGRLHQMKEGMKTLLIRRRLCLLIISYTAFLDFVVSAIHSYSLFPFFLSFFFSFFLSFFLYFFLSFFLSFLSFLFFHPFFLHFCFFLSFFSFFSVFLILFFTFLFLSLLGFDLTYL